jgi:hypothetical protein
MACSRANFTFTLSYLFIYLWSDEASSDYTYRAWNGMADRLIGWKGCGRIFLTRLAASDGKEVVPSLCPLTVSAASGTQLFPAHAVCLLITEEHVVQARASATVIQITSGVHRFSQS